MIMNIKGTVFRGLNNPMKLYCERGKKAGGEGGRLVKASYVMIQL
jgi:hypothetical protein